MRNKPRIRFKGFTEDWEQRKLGDIATITGGGTPSTNISEYWNGDIDWYSPVEIGEKRYASGSIRKITKLGLEKSSAKILPVGTVLFTSRAGIGNTAILQVEGCTNQGFQSITPNSKELDTYFLYTMTPKLKRYGDVTGAGSTFVEVSGKQMEQMNLMIPSLDEQKHVSQLFKVMDDAITLHQRKLEKLKLAKKALLQKLFPKNGSQFPEIRFKGFIDAWEQRKLLTVLNKIVDYRGRTPKKLGLDWSSTGHLALSALNVKMGYIDKTVDAHYGDDHLYSVWMKDNDLYEGQVLFTTEAPMGNVAQVPDDNKYILSQRTIAFVPDRSVISDNFLAVVLSASKCQKSLTNRASGGTAKGVSQKTLSEISLDIPQSLSEQDKVSELIKKLSKVITLHQCKLDKLQDVKKGLLQKMFV